MKSIYDVINALSICGRHEKCCIGCPYQAVLYPTSVGNTCRDVKNDDAVYYLKQYIMSRKHFEYLEEEYYKAIVEMEKNPPLTWDEICQMAGKPIWVENDGWEIVDGCTSIDFTSISGAIFRRYNDESYGNYGTDWNAYRKEKNDDA